MTLLSLLVAARENPLLSCMCISFSKCGVESLNVGKRKLSTSVVRKISNTVDHFRKLSGLIPKKSFKDIPDSAWIKIYLYLPLKDCWNLAQTCQIARHASKIDLIWEIKILQTFGIDVKKVDSPGPSARVFYQKVLYNYGVLIGLWQVTTFGQYGGLFQVSDQSYH